ncbi:hypothetical protein CLOM_g9963 [Closterium sp. NIES-68]|nr:hypothetical protein CLOM_g9963 [Closterium sp. NIES-68]
MLPRWATRRLARFILGRLVGRFLETNLSHEQIEVHLGSASIHLSDLRLNTEYLNSLIENNGKETSGTTAASAPRVVSGISQNKPKQALPTIRFVSGRVGKLSASLPIVTLTSLDQPCTVHLDGITLVAVVSPPGQSGGRRGREGGSLGEGVGGKSRTLNGKGLDKKGECEEDEEEEEEKEEEGYEEGGEEEEEQDSDEGLEGFVGGGWASFRGFQGGLQLVAGLVEKVLQRLQVSVTHVQVHIVLDDRTSRLNLASAGACNGGDCNGDRFGADAWRDSKGVVFRLEELAYGPAASDGERWGAGEEKEEEEEEEEYGGEGEYGEMNGDVYNEAASSMYASVLGGQQSFFLDATEEGSNEDAGSSMFQSAMGSASNEDSSLMFQSASRGFRESDSFQDAHGELAQSQYSRADMSQRAATAGSSPATCLHLKLQTCSHQAEVVVIGGSAGAAEGNRESQGERETGTIGEGTGRGREKSCCVGCGRNSPAWAHNPLNSPCTDGLRGTVPESERGALGGVSGRVRVKLGLHGGKKSGPVGVPVGGAVQSRKGVGQSREPCDTVRRREVQVRSPVVDVAVELSPVVIQLDVTLVKGVLGALERLRGEEGVEEGGEEGVAGEREDVGGCRADRGEIRRVRDDGDEREEAAASAAAAAAAAAVAARTTAIWAPPAALPAAPSLVENFVEDWLEQRLAQRRQVKEERRRGKQEEASMTADMEASMSEFFDCLDTAIFLSSSLSASLHPSTTPSDPTPAPTASLSHNTTPPHSPLPPHSRAAHYAAPPGLFDSFFAPSSSSGWGGAGEYPPLPSPPPLPPPPPPPRPHLTRSGPGRMQQSQQSLPRQHWQLACRPLRLHPLLSLPLWRLQSPPVQFYLFLSASPASPSLSRAHTKKAETVKPPVPGLHPVLV